MPTQSKVKIEPGTPAPTLPAIKSSRRSKQALPERFQEGVIWKASVIPTMIKWAAAQSRIFKISSEKMAPILQLVCRHYYEDESIAIAHKDLVVTRVCFLLCNAFFPHQVL